MKLVVIWANPDATCPTICYDGLAGIVTQTLTVGYYRFFERTLGAAVTPPTIKVTWRPQNVQVGDLGVAGYADADAWYDIKPVSKYDSDDTVRDSNRKIADNDGFTIVEKNTDQLCKEQWIYGDTFVACVKI